MLERSFKSRLAENRADIVPSREHEETNDYGNIFTPNLDSYRLKKSLAFVCAGSRGLKMSLDTSVSTFLIRWRPKFAKSGASECSKIPQNFDEIVETDVSRGIFRPRDLAQTKASEFLGL